jgi:ferric-dicitrate binding protein FerR (iron transport regulator)
MKKLLGLFAAVLVSVGLTGGLVAAHSGSLDMTGPDSDNEIRYENDSEVRLNNNTDLNADVQSDQHAESGDAKVKYNTEGGDAESGDAENENMVEAEVTIDNSGAGAAALACACVDGDGDATIDTTGPNSSNSIVFSNNHSVHVNNNTSVDFTTDTTQHAQSGDATVYYNTSGGNATSGNASNTSSTVFSLSVSN